jgi:HlyD family secretion protein
MRFWWVVVLVVAGGALAWFLLRRGESAESTYRFVTVERGDVESVVTSTGTLQATTTVQVGTQVSGQIAEIYVDFNDRVTRGQLIARIDPTLLQHEVRAAEAAVDRNKAEVEQTRREFERIDRLYSGKVATETEYNLAKYQYDVARSSLRSAEINLEKARRNLGYSEIKAPVDGVVLERNVDVGQTVAASLSAPQLFLIAGDLSSMEILAAVDESDIGNIQQSQEVRFTVQAYPNDTFKGTVSQVRLQSAKLENVVNYTVVVAVDNSSGRLLPGMTATVDFIVARETDVLKVANAAVRLRPTDEMQAALRSRRDAAGAGDSVTADSARRGDGSGRRRGVERARAGAPSRSGSQSRALLWFVDPSGKIDAVRVRTSVSDNQYTAVHGEGIQEGMQVIAAITTSPASAETPNNPFEQRQQPRGGPPRPPGF